MLAVIPHGICVECFADPVRDPLWPHLLPDAPCPKSGITPDAEAAAKFTIASAAL